MLSKRVTSALIMVPLFAALAYLGGPLWGLFVLAFMLQAGYEYGRLLKGMGYAVSWALLLGAIGLFIAQAYFFSNQSTSGAVVLVLTILANALLALLSYERGAAQAFLVFCLQLAGTVYLGYLGAYFIHLRKLPNGQWWLLAAMILVWLTDVGAYFAGTRWGRHKILPRLSPQKSWEGYAGSVIIGLIGGLLLGWASGALALPIALWQTLILGLLIGALTPFGDFFVSMIKRVAGVKDTGKLIPGHGGVLDRIDSWIWAVVIAFYFVQVISL